MIPWVTELQLRSLFTKDLLNKNTVQNLILEPAPELWSYNDLSGDPEAAVTFKHQLTKAA